MRSLMVDLAKTLIVFGILLAGIGVVLLLARHVPCIGKLPGDIYVQKKNVTFYFPMVTSLVVSIFLSLIFWLFSRR